MYCSCSSFLVRIEYYFLIILWSWSERQRTLMVVLVKLMEGLIWRDEARARTDKVEQRITRRRKGISLGWK